RSENTRRELRWKLGLPQDRPIVLSVGWISAEQKRMDYVVREAAPLISGVRGHAVPFLVMLGAMDEQSASIIALAREKLTENFTARSVPHGEVTDYYRASDLFVLASLHEGFGRVFLEALIHGLPVIVHDHPVMRFVLREHGTFADLSRVGVLAEQLRLGLWKGIMPETASERRAYVRRR